MGQFVLAVYRPQDGKEEQLRALLREHLPILRGEGLVTEHPPLVLRAADGTLIEIFEWKSQAAIDQAHENAAVQKLWERFAAVCTYETLASLPESQQLFAGFEPVAL